MNNGTVGQQVFVFPVFAFRRPVQFQPRIVPRVIPLYPSVPEPVFIWRLELQDGPGNPTRQVTSWSQPLAAMTEADVLRLARSIACREANATQDFRRVVATAKQTSASCAPTF